MKNSLISFLKQKVWGTSPGYASSETPKDRILEVYIQSTNEQRSLVGRLSYGHSLLPASRHLIVQT